MRIERFPIEAGLVLLFRRAIGMPDDDGGDLAPPTFVQSSCQFDEDWQLRPRPGQPWMGSSGVATGTPIEQDGSHLHAEQHFTYHRPLRIGDVLTVTERPGRSWTKEGRRGGLLLFAETISEYRDEAGEAVVTAVSVSVRTGTVVQQP